MAEVHVSTFQEFLSAIAVSGDTVICPEGAVWDMNEIDPENSITTISIATNINGNDTTISNFRGRIIFTARPVTVEKLHIINMFCTYSTSSGFDGAIQSGANNNRCYWKESRISAQLGASCKTMFSNIVTDKCSMNISYQASGTIHFHKNYSAWVSTYDRIKISAPNAQEIQNDNWLLRDSEIILDAPIATKIRSIQFENCTLRGNMQSVNTVYPTNATKQSGFSVIAGVADDFPTSNTSDLVCVTDAQLKDINYLHSIGFAIGEE